MLAEQIAATLATFLLRLSSSPLLSLFLMVFSEWNGEFKKMVIPHCFKDGSSSFSCLHSHDAFSVDCDLQEGRDCDYLAHQCVPSTYFGTCSRFAINIC